MRRNGLIAINLDEGDELLGGRSLRRLARHHSRSTQGMAVHFNEKDVRPMGRVARGVKAMTLDKGDTVIAMDVVEDERREVLLVTSLAFGKRTPIQITVIPRAAARASKPLRASATTSAKSSIRFSSPRRIKY